MNKIVIYFSFLLFCFSTNISSAQEASQQRFFKTNSLLFCGIDFTEVQLIHEEGFINKNGNPICESLTFKYFDEWNEVFIIERDKFDLSKFFYIDRYDIDNTIALERNKKYNTESCIIDDETYEVDQAKISKLVQAYTTQESKFDVGLVIVAESLSKKMDKGVFINVFFNLTTHEILYTEKIEGPPAGMGLRNYWINSLFEALKRCSKKHKKLRKQYN